VLFLGFEGTATIKPQIVTVYGSGLIGASIVKALRHSGHPSHMRSLNWTWPNPTGAQTRAVEAAFNAFIDQQSPSRITTIWAAGRSGFGSSEEDMSLEYQAFCGVRTLARKLAMNNEDISSSFIHISSAGGLFEGQIACDKDTIPQPIRAYGHGKLKQEFALLEDAGLGRRLVVRPSSVFGYTSHGRLGLVSALISAAIQNRDAVIFGALSTQRDFIFAPDIGRYISEKVLNVSLQAPNLERVILASGRPASIFEIIKTVEDVVGTSLYLKIEANPDNALNNTFRASVLPFGFIPTSLRQGIEQTKSEMENHSFGK
jgi:UDP-glucose 4-epimerase